MKRNISGAYVFALLGLFAVFGTLLVLTCAHAYRNGIDRAAAHNEARVRTAFARHAIRAEDAEGAVTAETIDGISVLKISDASGYITYLYAWNGSLRELYSAEDAPFAPERGEKIAAATGFTCEREDHLVTLHIQSDDGEETVRIALHAGEVAP